MEESAPLVRLLVICDEVTGPAERPNFTGVWNIVCFDEFPTPPFSVEVYAELEFPEPTYEIDIVLRTRYGEEFARVSQNILGSTAISCGFAGYRFSGAKLSSPGVYSVEIEYKNEIIGSRWFSVAPSTAV